MKIYTPFTIGSLIEYLDTRDEFTIQGILSYPDSYRGYYAHVALEPGKYAVSSKTFSAELKARLGETMQGYKGGDFVIQEDCRVFVAGWGDTGPQLVGFTEDGEPIAVYEVW